MNNNYNSMAGFENYIDEYTTALWVAEYPLSYSANIIPYTLTSNIGLTSTLHAWVLVLTYGQPVQMPPPWQGERGVMLVLI